MKLRYLVKKELIEVMRQKELLFLMFVSPVIQIVILGYVVSTDIRHVPVGLVNLSRNQVAERVSERVRRSPLFAVRFESRRSADYLDLLKQGRAKAIIVFRDPLDRKRSAATYPEVQVLMDGIDSNTAMVAAGYFNGIIKGYILDDLARRGRGLPVAGRPLFRFNPQLRSINYMGPGIVGFLLTIITMFLTSASLVREKEQQTMDTLLMSRLNSLEIYLGKALPAVLIGLIDMVIGLLVVILWFGIPFRGSLFFLFLASLVYLAAILSYALLISVLSATTQQSMFFAWFSLILFLLMSGFFTPVANIPQPLRLLADINPLRYLIQIIREIFLKGNGIAHFWKDLLALAGIAASLVSVSLLNFKRFISR
ncbi:MAG TPA: ABC transporter permease [Candidatus Aminicenantes bacterium]|nr:ABC transporter permease [Candidatus Aminicenantes bacterium]